mgnify:CR=1 FL=1
MPEKHANNNEFTWEDIWMYWRLYSDSYEPMLQEPINIERIKVNFHENGTYFQGYDWIPKGDYEDRVNYITNKPQLFLYFGQSLNKGTLHTLETLEKAGNNLEDIAAIWLAAFTEDILNLMPVEWRGKGFTILNQVCRESSSRLRDKYPMWHHAMRKLLPEICFSNELLGSINLYSFTQIVELAVIASSQILNRYITVEYDSRTL